MEANKYPIMYPDIKIEDRQLKSLIWSSQLSNAWRNYQFEKSEINSKQRLFWSILTITVSVMAILVSSYPLINPPIKNLFFSVMTGLTILMVVSLIKIIELSIKKVMKKDYIRAGLFIKLLNHFDETWIVGPILGKFNPKNESYVELQDFSIDTESWIKTRDKIDNERVNELLEKTNEGLSNLSFKTGEKFNVLCYIDVSKWGRRDKIEWNSGYASNKDKKLPLIRFNKNVKLNRGLYKIKGTVSDVDAYYYTFSTEKGLKKVLNIEESKLIEPFYNEETRLKFREYSRII